MEILPETSAFDRGVGPVMNIVLPGRTKSVIDFQADHELQERIQQLANKSTEGELTEQERAEYAGYVRANKFVAILKKQAHKLQSEPPLMIDSKSNE